MSKEKNKSKQTASSGIPVEALTALQTVDSDINKIEKELSVAFNVKKSFKYLSDDSNVLMKEVLKRFSQVNVVKNEDVFDCMLSRKLSQTTTVAAAIVSTGRGPTWEQAVADCVLNYTDYCVRVRESTTDGDTIEVSDDSSSE